MAVKLGETAVLRRQLFFFFLFAFSNVFCEFLSLFDCFRYVPFKRCSLFNFCFKIVVRKMCIAVTFFFFLEMAHFYERITKIVHFSLGFCSKPEGFNFLRRRIVNEANTYIHIILYCNIYICQQRCVY